MQHCGAAAGLAPAVVSYGPKGSGELLLSYGFCPPPAANPHTGYTLRVGLDAGGGDQHAEAKLEVLRRRGAWGPLTGHNEVSLQHPMPAAARAASQRGCSPAHPGTVTPNRT